jgi:hypothetical protein
MEQVREIAAKTPGVANVLTVAGYSLLTSASSSNAGLGGDGARALG